MYMTKDFAKTQTRTFNPVYIIDEEQEKERARQYKEFVVREKKSKKGKK